MIYLDHQATTPLDPSVWSAMAPYYGTEFGNPHSIENVVGQAAETAMEAARAQVASAIAAKPNEVIFTSGATEANNLAILGAARFALTHGDGSRNKVVTLATEHKCVLEAVKHCGLEAVILPVQPNGLLDLAALDEALDESVLLVSAMLVNNEIGVIQPIAEIAARAHSVGAKMHCDAAQALGKLPIDVTALNVDLLSLSAHKANGPMGIGALYVRHRPRMRLLPIVYGGNQERALRSGTVPLPLAVGFGAAADLPLSDPLELVQCLRAAVPDNLVHGDLVARVPHNLNLMLPGWSGEMSAFDGFALSTGSACSASAIEPSYVLRALGVSDEDARRSLRISLGRTTTENDINALVERITPWL